MLLSLGLAQLFNQRFPGRRVARWALIAPWAASVMMTALIFRWMLQPDNGAINVFLHQLGLVHQFDSNQSSWLGRPDSALAWMIGVAVFVSLPFTTYTLLAGLQAIPGELFEAARVDGASRWRAYRSITLPLLRPAFVVAAVINLMNVFNSFPIIWEMTRGGPGYETNTTTVFMYNLKESFVGQAAAMSIVNFTPDHRDRARLPAAEQLEPAGGRPDDGRSAARTRKRARAREPRQRRPRAAARRQDGRHRGRRLHHRRHLPAALPGDADHRAAAAAGAAGPRLPAAPLRLVEPDQHVGLGLRHHHQPAGQPRGRRRRDHPGRCWSPARGLLHGPAPVPGPRACSCSSCWPPRCSSRPR